MHISEWLLFALLCLITCTNRLNPIVWMHIWSMKLLWQVWEEKLIISSLLMDLFCQAQVEQFLFISMYLINHVGSIYWYSFLFVILSKCIDEVKDYSWTEISYMLCAFFRLQENLGEQMHLTYIIYFILAISFA